MQLSLGTMEKCELERTLDGFMNYFDFSHVWWEQCGHAAGERPRSQEQDKGFRVENHDVGNFLSQFGKNFMYRD